MIISVFNNPPIYRSLLVSFILFALVACGGGSSDESSTPMATTPTTATQTPTQTPTPTQTQTPTPTPTTPTAVPAVTGISLVDEGAPGDAITPLVDGMAIELASVPNIFNFTVDFDEDPGSVDIDLLREGTPTDIDRFENTAPFTVAEQGTGFARASFDAGRYTFTVQPFSQANLEGEEGAIYTIDVTFIDTPTPTDAPPSMPEDASITINENATTVRAYTALAGSAPITYTLGGDDAENFTVNASSGFITLNHPQDFENPGDANNDNIHNVTLTATNSIGSDTIAIAVTIANVTEGVSSTDVVTNIKASRTTCSSPCPVVFSAEDTTAEGLDEHGVWSQLSYHWDFDTDESDTYGGLYQQTYTYADGDTAREVGHTPMVTKTFLCATGVCEYNVGLRAQNAAGDFDDEFITITVNAESTQWSTANTVCVSNTLNTTSDWTAFDKACPNGATKTNIMLDADDYGDKLVLLRRGDRWEQNLATMMSEDNFKIGYFGNMADAKPEITGTYWHGASQINGPANAPTSSWSFANDTHASTMGWPDNNTLDGIALGLVSLAMSYTHATLHDVDLDRENDADGGAITIVRGHLYCYDFPDVLSCENVPFPKGAYISNTEIVSGIGTGAQPSATLNVGAIGCGMANWTGIVDSYFRKAFEHNLRVMGWYRLSIMRNTWAGEHYKSSKQKISTRTCNGGPNWPDWATWAPETFDRDPEGRTRADSELGNGTGDHNTGSYVHISRYQVTNGNQIGVAGVVGSHAGGPKYQTNIGLGSGHEPLSRDIIVTDNTFVDEMTTHTLDINAPAYWLTCIDNRYSGSGAKSCSPSIPPAELNMRNEPEITLPPLAPGS